MKRILWFIVVIGLTLLALVLLWQFRVSIVLFLLSLATAAMLRPLITNITNKKFTKAFALSFVYTLLVLSILLFIVLVGSPLMKDLEVLSDDIVTSYEAVKANWPGQTSLFKQALAEQLPPSTDILQALTSTEGQPVRESVWLATQNFFSLLGYFGIIIILSLYWTADQLRFERLTLSMFLPEHHARALHTWRSVESGVGAYLRSELTQGILAGFFLLVGYLFLDVRYPFLLALWAVLARLVPWFGVLIAVTPLAFLFAGDPSLWAFMPILYTLVILIFLKMVVEPRFIPSERYDSLLIVLFVIAMAHIFGLIGVFLAPILAVATQIFARELYPALSQKFSQQPLKTALDLRRRLRRIQMEAGRALPEEEEILIRRTHRLLARVRDYIVSQ